MVETQYPIPVTRCLSADARCPHSCILMGGAKLPFERETRSLNEVGLKLSPTLVDLEKRVSTHIDKPILYVLLDPSMRKGGFRGGIREYANVLVIWVNPLAPDFEYTLAHEYGHGLTMSDPEFAYLDPSSDSGTTDDRSVAGLASSVVDHQIVHRVLTELGFDPMPEARRRTAEAMQSLNPTLAAKINAAYERGDVSAKSFVLVNAEVLTTFRSEHTKELETKMRHLFSKEFMAAVDESVTIINERFAGGLTGVKAAKRLLRLIGRNDLKKMYVSRKRFVERLFKYGSR